MQYLESESRFYVPGIDDNEDIAEITYSRIGNDKASINHMYVDANYRGQGIADHLFDLLIDKMKREGRKIIPICSYAVKQFERRPELHSMLEES